MSTSTAPFPLPTSPEALTAIIRGRTPHAEARALIVETIVPMRTCYETMERFVGPVDAVLDYASLLFYGDDAAATQPTPPLTVEEAHVSDDGGTLTLVLSRGSYTIR